MSHKNPEHNVKDKNLLKKHHEELQNVNYSQNILDKDKDKEMPTFETNLGADANLNKDFKKMDLSDKDQLNQQIKDKEPNIQPEELHKEQMKTDQKKQDFQKDWNKDQDKRVDMLSKDQENRFESNVDEDKELDLKKDNNVDKNIDMFGKDQVKGFESNVEKDKNLIPSKDKKKDQNVDIDVNKDKLKEPAKDFKEDKDIEKELNKNQFQTKNVKENVSKEQKIDLSSKPEDRDLDKDKDKNIDNKNVEMQKEHQDAGIWEKAKHLVTDIKDTLVGSAEKVGETIKEIISMNPSDQEYEQNIENKQGNQDKQKDVLYDNKNFQGTQQMNPDLTSDIKNVNKEVRGQMEDQKPIIVDKEHEKNL
jgi:hypothetical protein